MAEDELFGEDSEGFWQHTIVEDGKAIDDSATSVTVKLPRANFIGGVGFTLRGTGGAGTPDVEPLIKKIEIVANGSSYIVNTHPDNGNRQIRDIMQFRRKGIRSEAVNQSGGATRVTTDILMGRYKHDKDIILPAFLFNSLYLKLTFDTLIASTAFATGTVKLDVFVDEWVSPEAAADEDYLAGLFIQKYEDLEGSVSTSASGDKSIELSLGDHLLAAIYAYASGTDGTTVSKVKVSLNHGAQVPLADTWLHSQSEDMVDYSLVGSSGAAKIANATMLDFDNPRTEQILEECISLSREDGIEKAEVIFTQGAASQTIEAVQISYIPVEAIL